MAGIIQRIFKENWHEFLNRYTSRVRTVVKEDVQRMMDCGDISKGYKLYSCTSCDEEKKWLLLVRVVFVVPVVRFMSIIEPRI